MASADRRLKKMALENDDNCCAVCFKSVEIYSIGSCDHKICFECSTRMRVLCKQMECPICRQELIQVAFVKNVKPYQKLTLNNHLMNKQAKIFFEDSNVQEAFGKLLINACKVCPSNVGFPSLQALKDHLRKEHEMFFCDLCVDNLKIFTWERRAYTRAELALHRRKGDPDNTSHRGHPLCNFCDQRYVDEDELFRHLRRDHYFCHFCDADGLNFFYCTYEDLRGHFQDSHFLCTEGDCKEETFTCVFRTDIDFRAHRAQAHSQTLGKAAAKHARTLEVEFTLAPRASETSARNQRRIGLRARERDESAGFEQPAPRFAGSAANIAADLRNPLDFPSLTAEQSSATTQGRSNGLDSLAQKLAKGNRLTVRNNGSACDEDEFPSLVTDSHSNHAEPSKPSVKGATGAKRSVHVRVNDPDAVANERSGVSVELIQKCPAAAFHGTGPPIPRVTRVSTSQNIHVQPTDMNFDASFPSLLPSTSHGQIPNKTCSNAEWVKKEPNKSSKNSSTSKMPSGNSRPQSSTDEYPTLVPSSLKSPLEATGSNSTRPKQATMEGNKKAKSLDGNRSVASAASAWSDPPKSRGKKKKNSSSLLTGNNDTKEMITFSSEAERKVSEMQIGELKSLSTHMGRTTLDLTGVANTAGRKDPTLNSKVGLVKQPLETKAAESSGVRPKTKEKAVSLNSSDFPALGMNSAATPSLFNKKPLFPSGPPRLGIENITPTTVTFTSSSGRDFPLSVMESKSGRPFLQPQDFAARNQQLVSTVVDVLCNQRTKINQFRAISTQFRNGQIEPKEYYSTCVEIMGDDCFHAVFPELLCLLPDVEKQQQLLKVHRSERRIKGGARGSEPYVVCATCNQVLAPADLKHHLGNHSLESHFHSLALPTDASNVWSKR